LHLCTEIREKEQEEGTNVNICDVMTTVLHASFCTLRRLVHHLESSRCIDNVSTIYREDSLYQFREKSPWLVCECVRVLCSGDEE